MVSGKNPRQIAARILSQRLTSGEFTEKLLETALATTRLSPADRALCHELVYGVVRWQATLDCLITRKTDPARQQRPALVNLLRLGLYQLFWLDRIPPHAAVHETVELAKHSGYAGQAGFINAVLRGYVRELDEIKKILADMKASQPALGWSHPDWLVERWREQFGDGRMRELLAWNNTPPRTCARVNSLRCPDPGQLLARWREENVEYDFLTRDWTGENLAFELKSHPPLNGLGTFNDGWFYLQDPSTLLAPVMLAPQPGETIWDACAAPGGKTTFIAQLMNNEGKIVAGDQDPKRLKLVRENCERLGVTCVQFGSRRGNEAQTGWPMADGRWPTFSQSLLTSAATGGEFDRILIDAPCSNTGVMRRRVDLRWRITLAEIQRLCGAQLELLQAAAPRLKAGGTLVYSTCSLETGENSDVVKQFLDTHSGFKLETERQLLPFADGVDGAYVAKLGKLI